MLWWDGKGEFPWEWLLEPLDDRMTRLLTRVQETYPPLWSRRMLYAVVASSGDIVMVRKQLRGIKARVEPLAAAAPSPGRARRHLPRSERRPPDDLLDQFIPHPAGSRATGAKPSTEER